MAPFAVRLGRAAALCSLLATASAHAGDPVLVPPRPVRRVEAVDPRPDGAHGRAVVEMEIEVDAEGGVVAARVVASAGEELDAAAIAAVKESAFEPATRDGEKVASRIRFAYAFEARVAPVGPGPDPTSPSAPRGEDERVHVHEFGARARVRTPAAGTTHALAREEIASVAGARGDPLRAIELLPGVSRPAAGEPFVVLRGANPFDTQVFMEGAPVPLLYHFGGLTSFVHSRVLEEVNVHPSNFPVRYGRKVGGVIEARLRDPRTDAAHGIAEASLLDTSLLVEAPVGEALSVLAAARRSNIDAVLRSADSLGSLGITSAPVYWDYQAVVAIKPTDRDRVRVLGYGSSDGFGAVLAHPLESDPALRGRFEIGSVFHRAQLGYRHRFDGGSETSTELTYGRTEEKGMFGGIGRFEIATDIVQARTDWTGVLAPSLRIGGGLDLLGNRFEGFYSGVAPDAGEGGGPRALSTQRQVAIDVSRWVLLPGAWLEAGVRPVPELLLTPGIRADYNDLIQEAAVDPRLSARLDATRDLALKAAVGRFSQSPDERHVVAPIGNPRLGMTHAIHASAGVEQALSEHASASVEGFGKWIDDVVAATPEGRPPFFVDDGRGRTFGGELLVRKKPSGWFSGFVAYTLMRSERRDPGGGWRLFDRDQTHILNATGNVRLGRGWEVGATVRYTSGTPYTPVTASTYDATADVYAPRLGRAMSARNPAFSRLDLRVQKTWTFSRARVSAYADVQNVLDAPNREGFTYSYDYGRRQGVSGLPILPIVGLRGEL